MRRKHKYANGGRVKCYSDGGKVESKPNGKVPPKSTSADPKMLGTGGASKTGKILRDRRREQMEELGI